MVSISPTWDGGMSNERPMSLSSATGTNSVVLKMKAASASAITLSQLPAGELCDSFMEKWVWYRFNRSKARRMRV